MDRLITHGIVLEGRTSKGIHTRLRPMTEDDWDILNKWNADPEILYYSEGDDVTSRTPEQVKRIYRGVCKNAFCFIIEADGQPVGECWLQRMNLEWILERHPGADCRRIDLMIGEKDFWGKGIGTEVICLVRDFGFEHEKADLIFACDIADYNPASQRAFKNAGFTVYSLKAAEPGRKSKFNLTMYILRENFLSMKE